MKFIKKKTILFLHFLITFTAIIQIDDPKIEGITFTAGLEKYTR